MRLPFKVYAVGGAVRDRLLGLPVKDRDWVVVGATAQQLIKAGFKPVGKDFPVFLHPTTSEEYALARTERKVAQGYQGFQFYSAADVTLEQDLARRDLTINAMAEDENGHLIDPYGGQKDLNAQLLRHVGPAFIEDPVRILRVARFAARFNFDVAPETMALMQTMVEKGEVNALVAERVWQEMARALMEDHPSRFFQTLDACGALACILPEITALFATTSLYTLSSTDINYSPTLQTVDYAARHDYSLAMRFSALVFKLGHINISTQNDISSFANTHHNDCMLLALCSRLRVSNECRDLARITMTYHEKIDHIFSLDSSAILELFKNTDAFRRPQRFHQMLAVCAADFLASQPFKTEIYPPFSYLTTLLNAASSIDAAAIARTCDNRIDIPQRLDKARIYAIETVRTEKNPYWA